MLGRSGNLQSAMYRIRKRLNPSHELLQRLKDKEDDYNRMEEVVRTLIDRHFHGWPIPPRELLLRISTSDHPAVFLRTGIHSSGHVLRVFGETPEGPVLDWGCGSGRTLMWLSIYPAWDNQYHGCDIDEQAIQWIRKQGKKRVKTCTLEPPLPFEDNYFGGLFGFSVLTHIHPEKHRLWYEELHRVLKPGGKAFVSSQGPSTVTHEDERVRLQFEKQDWSWVEYPGHSADSAVVTEAFTRRAIDGLFGLEEFRNGGYGGVQDTYELRRLP